MREKSLKSSPREHPARVPLARDMRPGFDRRDLCTIKKIRYSDNGERHALNRTPKLAGNVSVMCFIITIA